MRRSSEPGPRKTVYEAVVRNPGVHLREIERMTELPLGVVRHHLERMERDGLVFSRQDRHFKRFFSKGRLPPNIPTETFDALRQDGPRMIVLHLLNNPASAHGRMAEALGIPASTLSTYLSLLMRKKMVTRERRDRRSLYSVRDEEGVVKVLMVYKSSFFDALVDRAISAYLERG